MSHAAWHSTAQHGTARHSTAQHSTAQHSTAQHGTAQHSTAQHSLPAALAEMASTEKPSGMVALAAALADSATLPPKLLTYV